MNRRSRGLLSAAVIGLTFIFPEAAQAYDVAGVVSGAAGRVDVLMAYVDPGAAGFVIVTVLGFFAAIGYTARAYLSRMKQMLFRRGSPAQEGETPDPSDV